MLTTPELRRWVGQFGVAEHQVRRDHLVSHVLHALGQLDTDQVFFGGTALCRTHLPDWRLSEDIDLLTDEPGELADRLHDALPHLLRREHPGTVVDLHRAPAGLVGTIETNDLRVRLQLVDSDASYRRYPAEPHPVALRYEDLPAHVTLDTPTVAAAGAMKLNSWAERAAPRDLADLLGLVRADLLDHRAVELAQDAGWRPTAWMFAGDRTPTAQAWQAALGHQMAELLDPAVALATVRAHLFDESA